jgi:hypothetical protein
MRRCWRSGSGGPAGSRPERPAHRATSSSPGRAPRRSGRYLRRVPEAPPTAAPLLAVLAGVAAIGVVAGLRYSGPPFLRRAAGAAAGALLTVGSGYVGFGRASDHPSTTGLLILLAGPVLAALVTGGLAVAEASTRRALSGYGLLRVSATALTCALLWFIAFPMLLGQSRATAVVAWVAALAALVAWAAAAYGPDRASRQP